MDKIAANNHIVELRKELKKAKTMVNGNLIRKIKKLRDDKQKLDENCEKAKLDAKTARLEEELAVIKCLDAYPLIKRITLDHNIKNIEKAIHDIRSSPLERVSAKILTKNNVKKKATKFRTDHKDCDEWLSEYFEYREKKKEIKDIKPKKHVNKIRETPEKVPSEPSKPFNKRQKLNSEKNQPTNDRNLKPNNESQEKPIHPSWEAKKRQRELLQSSLRLRSASSKRVIFNN